MPPTASQSGARVALRRTTQKRRKMASTVSTIRMTGRIIHTYRTERMLNRFFQKLVELDKMYRNYLKRRPQRMERGAAKSAARTR